MNSFRLRAPWWSGFLAVAIALAPAAGLAQQADPKPAASGKKSAARKAPRFIRVVRNKKTGEPMRMETATVRYVLAGTAGQQKPVTLDLIAVVHVGERAYYDRLNTQFEQYDALLYELVSEQGARPDRKSASRSQNPAAMLQGVMKSMLELDHQLERVDYSKDNFVHADLSPQQMQAAMKKRGDTGLTIALGVLADMIRQQNLAEENKKKNNKNARPVEQVDFLTLIADPNGPVKMKRMMAEQMTQMETGSGVGKTLDRILITDRNQAAIAVLKEQLDKKRRRLGLFYGAAHMPDFHARITRLGFKLQSTHWSTAWDLRIKRRSETDDLIQLFRLLQRLSQ